MDSFLALANCVVGGKIGVNSCTLRPTLSQQKTKKTSMNSEIPPISEKEMRKLMSKALIKVGECLAN
jgi:hypothetical protein